MTLTEGANDTAGLHDHLTQMLATAMSGELEVAEVRAPTAADPHRSAGLASAPAVIAKENTQRAMEAARTAYGDAVVAGVGSGSLAAAARAYDAAANARQASYGTVRERAAFRIPVAEALRSDHEAGDAGGQDHAISERGEPPAQAPASSASRT